MVGSSHSISPGSTTSSMVPSAFSDFATRRPKASWVLTSETTARRLPNFKGADHVGIAAIERSRREMMVSNGTLAGLPVAGSVQRPLTTSSITAFQSRSAIAFTLRKGGEARIPGAHGRPQILVDREKLLIARASDGFGREGLDRLAGHGVGRGADTIDTSRRRRRRRSPRQATRPRRWPSDARRGRCNRQGSGTRDRTRRRRRSPRIHRSANRSRRCCRSRSSVRARRLRGARDRHGRGDARR